MLLRNVRPFGNFTPGQTVEVPDGSTFDGAFFEKVPETEEDNQE
jgi:hypothetical protein